MNTLGELRLDGEKIVARPHLGASNNESPPGLAAFKTRREIFEHPSLAAYDKAQLLAAWDKAHPGEPEPPPRLNANERAAVAEAATKLKALKAGHVELTAKREQAAQALEQSDREKRKLETTCDFDDARGIQSLVHVSARIGVIKKFLETAPAKSRTLENSIEEILRALDQLFTRRFGQDRQPGGRQFANCGFGSLVSRVDLALVEIERTLR